MQLQDKVVLITGARRIGAVVAMELARRNADVALSYNRSKQEAEATVAAIRALGRRATVQPADVTRADECQALVQHTVSELGRLDVLINMASIYIAKAWDETSETDWDLNLAVNLKSAYLCARAAVPHMRAAGGGRIINFADWIAPSGRPRYKGYLPYYVAKAGVVALTEALALELAQDNILVNAIAPGPIVAPPDLTPDQRRSVEEATPLGRWGGEIEIAKVVLALIDTDFVTGETVRVDGGRHVR